MSGPLPSQRHLFDVPRDVAYFNAAAYSPLPRPVVEAGERGVHRKAQPWTLAADLQDEQSRSAREAAARLIGADPHDVALTPSVGYGAATAAKAMRLSPGSTVVVLEDDHSAPVLEWTAGAADEIMNVHTVARPADGDWTAAVLEALDALSSKDVALVSISNVHWSDGGMIDLARVVPAIRRAGARFLLDATHAVGVVEIDVEEIDPDFLLFPTYKWLLGPYGRGFMYVAKRNQDAVPLEQTMFGRRRVRAEDEVYFSDLRYKSTAERFDMSERDYFITLDMAITGMKLVHEWGIGRVRERLLGLTRTLETEIAERGLPIRTGDPALRAPHLLSLAFEGGMPDDLVPRLKAENVFAAPRLGRLRVAPHVYNDEEDCARMADALARALA